MNQTNSRRTDKGNVKYNHISTYWPYKLGALWEEVSEALKLVFHQNIQQCRKVALQGGGSQCVEIKWIKLDSPTYNIWDVEVL